MVTAIRNRKESTMVRVDKETHDTLKTLSGDIPLTRYIKRLVEKADKEGKAK